MTTHFPWSLQNMSNNPNRVKGSGNTRTLNELLQVTIKDTLLDIFGEGSTKKIFNTMETVHSIRLEDVYSNSQLFNVALKEIIGSGHQIVEDLILENLFDKTGKVFEYRENFSFSDYVKSIEE